MSFLDWADAWLSAVLLAGLMFGGWVVGRWIGSTRPTTAADPPAGKFLDASLALLGLLLAFTFSMALHKHDQRRTMVVTESNAVGDFYTCASLLKEPTRERLQDAIRGYAQVKLDLAQGKLLVASVEEMLPRFQMMHGQMTALVAQGLADGTPIAVPLTNTLNNLTSAHAARLAAYHDRLPWCIVLLLFLGAIISMVLIGRQQGASGKPHLLGTLSFIVLVALVVDITLDLNQPRKGLITVSQEPLEHLLSGMAK